MTQIALISFLTNSINTRLLSAYLKKHGYAVTCYFCPEKINRINIELLIKSLRERGVTFVGVSLVTDDFLSAVLVTKAIKDEMRVPVIWGGAHVNIMPEESLRHADMICKGEGEEALLELVDKMYMSGAPDITTRNIWFKTDNGIVRNELRPLEENLDKYPFPDFDLDTQFILHATSIERFEERHMNAEYSIMTSRGCPYKCSYCYNSYRWKQYEGLGKYLRVRSVDNVIRELVLAKQLFPNMREINIWDDSFVARNMDDFVVFQKQYREHVHLPYFALIEPMAFQAEKIAMLKECGLKKLQVGIQSGSERVNREVYGRSVSSKKVLEVAEAINRMGIGVVYDLIFNNPYESREDVCETIDLLLRFPKPFRIQGYNLIFYPGSEITNRALNDGHISLKVDVGDDFSTIQGMTDTPALRWHTDVSGRFYSVNFDSHQKDYLNALVFFIPSRFIPSVVIRYFARSETVIRRYLLRWFTFGYASLVRFRVRIFPKLLCWYYGSRRCKA